MRFLGNFGRLVIADMRVQRGNQHQRLIQQLADAIAIRFNAHSTMLIKALHAVSQQADRLQIVVDHHRPEHV
ncbi:hypothetical protein D3C72_1948850 [compost metagenome]